MCISTKYLEYVKLIKDIRHFVTKKTKQKMYKYIWKNYKFKFWRQYRLPANWKLTQILLETNNLNRICKNVVVLVWKLWSFLMLNRCFSVWGESLHSILTYETCARMYVFQYKKIGWIMLLPSVLNDCLRRVVDAEAFFNFFFL